MLPVYEDAGRELPRAEEGTAAMQSRNEGEDDPFVQLLLLASLHELAELRRRIPLIPLRRRQPLSRAAVRVSSLVVRERLRLHLGGLAGARERRWEPYIARVEEDLKRIERLSGFDRWQEHYNVACIYALPLLTAANACERDDVKQLACRAVERLERASERADSAYLASRRDWIVSEDPDLRGLRIQPRFKTYEAAYFPSIARVPQRPREVHRWAAARYTLDLLRAAAQRWEATWEKRALEPPTDAGVLLHWCADELSARRLVRDVALHHRDWRTRLQLLDQMSAWSVEYGFEPLETAFPSFPGAPTAGDGDVERTTRAAIGDTAARLTEVVERLAQAEAPRDRSPHENNGGQAKQRVAKLIDGVETWWLGLGQPDASPPRLAAAQVAELCCVHATLWRRLAELVTPQEERGEAARELARALARSAGACQSVEHQWHLGAAAGRAHSARNGAGLSPHRAVPSI